eukprot:TRINITY_DN271_c0_g1_i1.p1 TRINITY_DN271_c0_g1~~TRINITY_DN271_c0_g1_i1.p1  ORF type:complete len:240 (+),score=51.46 TRINITY_DN271_c0_g1_i1:147-866(+)
MSSLPRDMKFGPIGSWDANKKLSKKEPFIIGVCGGTASGKTSVCELIISELKDQRVATISLDSFYRPLTNEERQNVAEYNFDHPDAFDWELTIETLRALKDGTKRVEIPQYDFVTHSRLNSHASTVYGADVVIFEGILVFTNKELRNCMDMKIFVDADPDTRLARRVVRDINHRGRDVMGVIRQYEKFVKPAFEEYILPSKRYADVIIPRGADNLVAINLIVQHIKSKLETPSKKQGWF